MESKFSGLINSNGLTTKKDIRKLSILELQEMVSSLGEPAYRARQIYEWMFKKNATDFDHMTNLSKDFRERLKDRYNFFNVNIDLQQDSADGTVKLRHSLHDLHRIESVLIPVVKDQRFTACVSSQVGCSLSCTFCATGKMDRIRNLEAAEIFDQVVALQAISKKRFGNPLTNIVYMGMGEPLLNYRNVIKSIELLTSQNAMGMSPKRITVSTAGISKLIRKLADDGVKFNIALSLHAADDAKRDEIMPINEQNDLESLHSALQYFYRKTRNRISYEYIAFQDFNDSIDDAKKLLRLCKSFPVRVNIIEYNPIDGSVFTKSGEEKIDRFARYLRDQGVMVTLRKSRGRDIDAACGQLANKA